MCCCVVPPASATGSEGVCVCAVVLCHPLLPRQARGSVYVLLRCATRFCHGKRGGLCMCCCVVPPASATGSEGVCVCAVWPTHWFAFLAVWEVCDLKVEYNLLSTNFVHVPALLFTLYEAAPPSVHRHHRGYQGCCFIEDVFTVTSAGN
jgi:hypothetical protein